MDVLRVSGFVIHSSFDIPFIVANSALDETVWHNRKVASADGEVAQLVERSPEKA